LIDPLEYRAREDAVSYGFFPSVAFDELAGAIPQSFFQSTRLYGQELAGLSKARRLDGRPLFHGLGLYPEIGADLMPLACTRSHGRLVGMSLHEGELLPACALLGGIGYSWGDLLGSFIDYGPIRRDIDVDALKSLSMKSAREIKERVMQGRRRIGGSVGVRAGEWGMWGRYLNWEHFTFLPSYSGDQTVLEDYLWGQALPGEPQRGRKFDYLILKGMRNYGFRGEGGELRAEYEGWLRRLDERFMAGDAVAFVSSMDKQAAGVLDALGYLRLDTPKPPAYPEDKQMIQVSGKHQPRDLQGVRIFRGQESLAFAPIGEFTVLQKARA